MFFNLLHGSSKINDKLHLKYNVWLNCFIYSILELGSKVCIHPELHFRKESTQNMVFDVTDTFLRVMDDTGSDLVHDVIGIGGSVTINCPTG